jgi:hypothetical protein
MKIFLWKSDIVITVRIGVNSQGRLILKPEYLQYIGLLQRNTKTGQGPLNFTAEEMCKL